MIFWARTDKISNGQHEVNRRLLALLQARPAGVEVHHVALKGRVSGFIQVVISCVRNGDRMIYISGASGRGLLLQAIQVAVLHLLFAPRVYLHLHSARHLNGSIGMAVLAGLPGVTLVFLNIEMQRRYRAHYEGITRSIVIDNSVFYAPTYADTLKRSVLFLSRVEREKGIDRFLALADALSAQNSKINFDVAGPVNDPSILNALRERKHVTYHGEVTNLAKQALLDAAAVFVFPSRYRIEAFSLSVIEAAAAGAVPVCSTSGFHAEFLNEIGGIEVQDWADLDALCSSVSESLEHRNLPYKAYETYRLARLPDLESWLDDLLAPPRPAD